MKQDTNITELSDGGALVQFSTPGQVVTSEVVNIVEIIKREKDNIYPSHLNESTLLDGASFLTEMGLIVCEDYDNDIQARKQWEDGAVQAIKFFNSYMPIKSDPWEGCSNVNLPFIVVAVLQFQARAYEAIIPQKNIVGCIPTGGYEDEERAKRVAEYMNYQLLYLIEDFEESFDEGLIILPLVGSMFKKSYYDHVAGMPVSRCFSGLDIVINYCTNNEDRRYSHRIFLSKNSIRKRVSLGVFSSNAWDLDCGNLSNYLSAADHKIANIEGHLPTLNANDVPRLFIEQQRNWDLDGDGIEEPVVITVDYETKQVVRITDRRYKDAFGKEQVIDYYTHYKFFPNPKGMYGLGYGILLGGLNKAGNDIANEIIDAGTLANTQGGFISKNSGIKRGDIKITRGEFKEVNAYVDDLKKAFFTFDFKGPNQTLFATLGLLYEYSKLVSGLSETMTGQLPASDTPATTVLALIEEGRKLFSSVHKRIHRSFKKELKKIYRLNSIFIDNVAYYKLIGDQKIPFGKSQQIAKTDFVDSQDVIPISDPMITSRAEQIIKAKDLLDTTYNNPDLAQNPTARRIALERYLTIIEAPNIEQMLPQNTQAPELNPYEENALFLQEKTSVVYPKQDHNHHIQEHSMLLDKQNTFGASITNEGKRIVEIHNREHLAALYLQMTSAMQGEQNANR